MNTATALAEQLSEPTDCESHPDLNHLTTVKIPHRNLILAGVAIQCAHCGMALTDSISVQRSLGPRCSRKGYSEEPVDGDEMQAMIDLAEFPELVEFLTEHYKPLGIRGLVNGLVRVCSLNRPRGRAYHRTGNEKVFSACCDAVESLGHRKMASLLRNTLAVVSITDAKNHPGCIKVWVKKSEWTWSWSRDVKQDLNGAFYSKEDRGMIVPIYHPDHVGDKMKQRLSAVPGPNGEPLTNRRALWDLLVKHYEGCVVKKDGEAHKIRARS